MSKDAKHWIVSAGFCLLTLTGMNLGIGQDLPVAPIPEGNSILEDGLPALTEPAPLPVPESAPQTPTKPVTPAVPADIAAPEPESMSTLPAPTVPVQAEPSQAVPTVATPAPAAYPTPAGQVATPAPVPAATPAPAAVAQQPCQQCEAVYGQEYPAVGQQYRPWWSVSLPSIRPVPYTPVKHAERDRGFGGGVYRGGWDRRVPIEPPFYSTHGPRDFYLNDPRPLGP